MASYRGKTFPLIPNLIKDLMDVDFDEVIDAFHAVLDQNKPKQLSKIHC